MLAERPELGRNAEELARDLKRSEYRSHVVFYVPKSDGVRIVRVLHEAMDVKWHMSRLGDASGTVPSRSK
jgi:toxin ParE1/3/4